MLSLHYKDATLVDVRTGPGFTDEVFESIVARVRSSLLGNEGTTVIYPKIMFSAQKLEGFWRHRDMLQILPAPSDFPQVPDVLGDHPFILEFPVRRSPEFFIEGSRAARRYHELGLVLSTVCLGRITQQSPRVRTHWAIVNPRSGGEGADSEPRWVQEGFHPPAGFVVRQKDFSDTDRLLLDRPGVAGLALLALTQLSRPDHGHRDAGPARSASSRPSSGV